MTPNKTVMITPAAQPNCPILAGTLRTPRPTYKIEDY